MIIIAPAKIITDLKSFLNYEMQQIITAEVNKDFTKKPLAAISDYLGESGLL